MSNHIHEPSSSIPPTVPSTAFVTVREAADYLAVSLRTLDRIIARRDIQAVRIGRGRGVRRIARAELDRVIAHPDIERWRQEPTPPPVRLVPAPKAPPAHPRQVKCRCGGSKHRGVQVIRPSSGHPDYRLRWTDPDDRRMAHRNMTAAESVNADTRCDAAIGHHTDLKTRRRQIDLGAAKYIHGATAIEAAGLVYLASNRHTRKRPSTRAAYQAGWELFCAWCVTRRHTTMRAITRAMLAEYADARGGIRTRDGAERSPATVNKELKWLRAVLKELHRRGYLGCTLADIEAGLELLAEDVRPGGVYRTDDIAWILGGCHQHDVATLTANKKNQFARRSLPVTLFGLLTGLRPKEALELDGTDVVMANGHPRIIVRSTVAKTRRERYIDTAHSPLLAYLVSARMGQPGPLLGGTKDGLRNAVTAVRVNHGAPFTWKALRRTCGSYLTCAPAIFGAASAYMSAAQLGHTVATAQKNYLNTITGIPADARTTEDAMGIPHAYVGRGVWLTVTVPGADGKPTAVRVPLARL